MVVAHELAHTRGVHAGADAFSLLRLEEYRYNYALLARSYMFEGIKGLALKSLPIGILVVPLTAIFLSTYTAFSYFVSARILLAIFGSWMVVMAKRIISASFETKYPGSNAFLELKKRSALWVSGDSKLDIDLSSGKNPLDRLGELKREYFKGYTNSWKLAAIVSGFAEQRGLPRQAAYDILRLNLTRKLSISQAPDDNEAQGAFSKSNSGLLPAQAVKDTTEAAAPAGVSQSLSDEALAKTDDTSPSAPANQQSDKFTHVAKANPRVRTAVMILRICGMLVLSYVIIHFVGIIGRSYPVTFTILGCLSLIMPIHILFKSYYQHKDLYKKKIETKRIAAEESTMILNRLDIDNVELKNRIVANVTKIIKPFTAMAFIGEFTRIVPAAFICCLILFSTIIPFYGIPRREILILYASILAFLSIIVGLASCSLSAVGSLSILGSYSSLSSSFRIIRWIFPETIYIYSAAYENEILLRDVIDHEIIHLLLDNGDIKTDLIANAVGDLRFFELCNNSFEIVNKQGGKYKERLDDFKKGVEIGQMAITAEERYEQTLAYLKSKHDVISQMTFDSSPEGLWTYTYGSLLGGIAYALSVRTGDPKDRYKFIRLIAEGKSPVEAEEAVMSGSGKVTEAQGTFSKSNLGPSPTGQYDESGQSIEQSAYYDTAEEIDEVARKKDTLAALTWLELRQTGFKVAKTEGFAFSLQKSSSAIGNIVIAATVLL
ncbi:MAG: hypothetical protein NTY47_07345, partial [Candidatus Omnitrophica bacterium]|nr:hypothetical protein [Candidatus Omnitrophota bacterium]